MHMTTVHNGVAVITAEARVGAGYDVVAVGRCADTAAMPNSLAKREDLDAAAGLVKSVRHRERQSPLNHLSDRAGQRRHRSHMTRCNRGRKRVR
jgi:hypothetical protein